MTSLTKDRLRDFITHLLIWVCLYGIILFQYYFQFKTISTDLIIRSIVYIVLFYFNYFYLVPVFVLKKRITTYIIISILIIVFSVFLTNYFFLHNAPKMSRIPFPEEFKPFPEKVRISPNRFMPRLNNNGPGPGFGFMPFIMPSLILTFNFLMGSMVKIYLEWNRNEVLRKKVENEKVTSELQFLKTQLNPHFLFNSLNAIYSLSVKKSTDAPEAIINLSELMRYMLYEANRDLVPLKKELSYIKNYVQLQRLRLSDSEKVIFNIFGDEKDKKITPLLFISFIENAFKYGTDYKGKTDVKITISIKKDTIHLFVKNKIGYYRKESQNSGVGLENIENRLNLLYPESHTLIIKEHKGYYTVDLTLNLNEHEVYNN